MLEYKEQEMLSKKSEGKYTSEYIDVLEKLEKSALNLSSPDEITKNYFI